MGALSVAHPSGRADVPFSRHIYPATTKLKTNNNEYINLSARKLFKFH
jgi:hypothetical protein